MYRFPGPEGVTYGVQIYPSCHYCSTPAGVDLYRFGPDEADEWLDGVEEAPFVPYSNDDRVNAQLAIPVVDPEKLAEAMSHHYEEAAAEDGDETSREIAEEDMRHVLPDAVYKTLEEWHRLPTAPPNQAGGGGGDG
jgi:hypothetical protein